MVKWMMGQFTERSATIRVGQRESEIGQETPADVVRKD